MQKAILYLYIATIFYAIFYGARAWFTWNINGPYVNLALFIIILSFFFQKKFRTQISPNNIIAFGILLLSYVTTSDMSINGMLNIIFILCVSCSVFLLPHCYIRKLFYTIQNILFYLLIPAIILHIILLIVNIPSISIISHPSSDNYVYFNYLFLIKNHIIYNNRFCGFCLEPGNMAALCCFMLYIDNFDLKNRKNFILILAVLLSLSLAGYILLILGYMFSHVTNIKSIIKKVIQILIIILAFYYISTTYNDGKNIINETIIERLTPDKEKGIAGNNRVTKVVDDYYEEFVKSNYLLLGYGNEKFEKIRKQELYWIAAGYKPFIMQYGLLRLIGVIAFYFIIAFNSKNRFYSMGFFTIIVLYSTSVTELFSYMWITLFLIGIKMNQTKQKRRLMKLPQTKFKQTNPKFSEIRTHSFKQHSIYKQHSI